MDAMTRRDQRAGPSPHLTWAELACHDAARTPYPVRWRTSRAGRLATVFEAIRHAGGDHPLRVLSGYRTPTHNRTVSGARHSQHVQGRALDLVPPGGWTETGFHAVVRAVAREDPRIGGRRVLPLGRPRGHPIPSGGPARGLVGGRARHADARRGVTTVHRARGMTSRASRPLDVAGHHAESPVALGTPSGLDDEVDSNTLGC